MRLVQEFATDMISETPTGRRGSTAVPLTVVLCALAMVAEGFDTYSIGFVVPMIIRQWGTTPQAIGMLLGASVILSALGTMAIGPIADRYGRKRCLVAALAVFGAMTLATAFVTSIGMLALVRSLSSLALGASVPVAVALGSDAVTPDRRATVAAMMSASIAVGIVAASLSAAAVVARFGWPAPMLLGGVFAIVLAITSQCAMPDIRVAPKAAASSGALATIFGARRYTAAFLVAVFALASIFAVTFFFNFWLPTLMMQSHASIGQAALVSAVAQATSLIGAFAAGRSMDRHGLPALAIIYLATATVLLLVMALPNSLTTLALGVILLCLFLNGAFGGAMALPVRLFPAELRATAVGTTVGAGRLIGGSLGPMIGGWLLGGGMPHWVLGLAFAPPLLVAAALLFACGTSMSISHRNKAGRQPPWKPRKL